MVTVGAVARQPPRVGEQVADGLVTLRRVLLQAARDDGLGGGRHRAVERGGRRVDARRDALVQLAEGLGLERHVARQHLVEEDAERPDVRARVGPLAAQLFGRKIDGRADDHADLRHGLAGLGAGDAEIQQLDLPARGDLDVVRLDVAVDDAVLVDVFEGLADFLEHVERLVERELAQLADALGERLAVHVLHDDAGLALALDEVVERGDVRVLEARLDARLVEEALDGAEAVARVRQRLDRHHAVDLRVDGPIHLSHPALAEVIDHAVFADDGALLERPFHNRKGPGAGGRGPGERTGFDRPLAPDPRPPLSVRHQLFGEADRDGVGDGRVGRAGPVAGEEDGDDAPFVVEDGAARVARAGRGGRELVGVADLVDDRVLAAAGLLLAVDGADGGRRQGRVRDGLVLRLAVEDILRLDLAVGARRRAGVAHDGDRLADLGRVVVVVQLDLRQRVERVHLDGGDVVAVTGLDEARGDAVLLLGEGDVEHVVHAVEAALNLAALLLGVDRHPVRGRPDEHGGAVARQQLPVQGEDDAGRRVRGEAVGGLPRRGDVAVREDQAVAGDDEAGARVRAADGARAGVVLVGEERLVALADGDVGREDRGGARHERLVVRAAVGDELVVDLRLVRRVDEPPRALDVDDGLAVVLGDLRPRHRLRRGLLGDLRLDAGDLALDLLFLLRDHLLLFIVAPAEEARDRAEQQQHGDERRPADGEELAPLLLLRDGDVLVDHPLDRGLADLAGGARRGGGLPGGRDGRGAGRGHRAGGARLRGGGRPGGAERGGGAADGHARGLDAARGPRLKVELELGAARPELHHVARPDARRAADALAVDEGAVAAVEVCDGEDRGVVRVLRDARVLAPDEVVTVRVVTDGRRRVAPQNQLFDVIEGELLDLVGLRAAQVPENYALHESLLGSGSSGAGRRAAHPSGHGPRRQHAEGASRGNPFRVRGLPRGITGTGVRTRQSEARSLLRRERVCGGKVASCFKVITPAGRNTRVNF